LILIQYPYVGLFVVCERIGLQHNAYNLEFSFYLYICVNSSGIKNQIMKQISIIRHNFFLKVISFLLLIAISLSCQNYEEELSDWSLKVNNRIQSNPVVSDGIVYFGCNDSLFYAVDASKGILLWKRETGNMVRSKAVIENAMVYFSTGNVLFALNKFTGEEIWIHSCEDTTGSATIDPWDYHQGSPVIHGSNVYVGFGNGSLLGFDLQNGKVRFNYTAKEYSPVRSTPAIKNGVIYFGDWNGLVYAVDIKTQDTLWTHRTYYEQPYSTFGMINTQMIVHDTLLIFGARNPELQVLNIYTGKVVWSHVETDGGWISGDPEVSGDTLYIGGSDNHKLIAFDTYSGDIFWDYEFLFNNFSKPIVKDNLIFFTTGDAYAFSGNYLGNGYLYALGRSDGSIKNMIHIDGNIFNSPVLTDQKIIFGGDDMILRAIDYYDFVNPTRSFPEDGKGPMDKLQITYDTVTNIQTLTYSLNFDALVKIQINNLEGEELRQLTDENQVQGDYELSWDGKNEAGQFVPDGYYIIETRSGMFIKNKITYFVF